MIYKDKLKELRESEIISQNELANILNISRKTYQHYESEYAIIPIKYLNTLCNYFNVSIDYIFELAENKIYKNYRKEIDLSLSSKRLKEFRKEKKLTQEALSQNLNVLRQTISAYESSKNIIATPFLYQICRKYKISADYLLGKIDEPIYLK